MTKNPVRISLRDVRGFPAQNRSLTLLIALAALTFSVVMYANKPLLMAAVTFALTTAGIAMVLMAVKTYERRMDAPVDPLSNWRVVVNGVLVGKVTDQEYAAIKRSVVLDTEVYLRQLANIVMLVIRAMNEAVTFVPAVVFWGTLFWLGLDSESALQALQTIQTATTDQLAGYAQQLIYISFMVGVVAILAVNNIRGFDNQIETETHNRLLRHVKCAAAGTLMIYYSWEPETSTEGQDASAEERAAHDRAFRDQAQDAIDDPQPSIPHDQVMADAREIIDQHKNNS